MEVYACMLSLKSIHKSVYGIFKIEHENFMRKRYEFKKSIR